MNASSDELVRVHYEGSVAVMTLNNPKRMNALSVAGRKLMYEHLLEIESNEACRAIVLTGADGNFCAGGDITEMKRRPLIEGRMRVDLPTRIFRLLVTGPKPYVCAVEGNAFGCGLSFIAASDYAVAATTARFSCAFIKVGLIPDYGGLWSIARKIGHRKAMEMAAFADIYTAEQALALGLVNRLCNPGQALTLALEAAERLAKNPPIAMALLKSALNSGADTIEEAIATETNFLSVLQTTDDFDEAARAFLEKRKPIFTGR